MNDTEPATPASIPEFFWQGMQRSEMTVIAENVAVMYEQGQGGDIVTHRGTLIQPNEDQERMTPGMLWLMPSMVGGRKAQTDELVQILQISRRFIIEIGSTYSNDTEDSE